MAVEYLTLKHVLALHDQAIQEFGGLAGVRSMDLLASAVATPQQSAFTEDAYPTIPEKAGAYAASLSENQPFLDGNKRTAAAAMLVFLDINGYELEQSDDEIATMIEDLAQDRFDRAAFINWVVRYARPISSSSC
jgi:death on curing protein